MRARLLSVALVVLFVASGVGGSAGAQLPAEFTRVAGGDRIDTAAKVAREFFPRADAAVLAVAGDFADALSGGGLAAVVDAPLLLTDGDELSAGTAAALVDLGVERVRILGGPSAIREQVVAAVEALGIDVDRIGGHNRFATAAAIADVVAPGGADEIVVALGSHEDPERAWADALAAGAFTAGSSVPPVLLTRADHLPSETRSALQHLLPAQVILIGGTAAVSAEVEDEITALGHDVRRMAGKTRFETSAAVVADVIDDRDDITHLVVASGDSFADALAAGALGPRVGPLLLVPSEGEVSEGSRSIQSGRDWETTYVIGGDKAVTEGVLRSLNGQSPPAPSESTEPQDASPIGSETQQPPADGLVRAFTADSYWNTPLPTEAPRHPNSDGIIGLLRSTNINNGCFHLSGAGSNTWGMPVYWADGSSPTYNVTSRRYDVPPEFSSLRIPRGASAMPTSDGEMVVFDVERGVVAELSAAVYDAGADTWNVEGGSIAYLGSNGLAAGVAHSDEPRNTGTFRGYNGAVAMIRHDLVQAGAIDHVVKIGVRESRSGESAFPMSGTDGWSTNPDAPVQGSRIRIKPSTDLAQFGLHPEARVIAENLQRYGAVIGDTTGGPIELKLEATTTEGRGQLWNIDEHALCQIPIEAFEIIEPGYGG